MIRSILFRSVYIFLAVIALPGITSGQLADPIKPGGTPIGLETVATGLTAPNWGTFAPGDTGRLFVTDQNGILWAIDLASGDKMVFADVSELLDVIATTPDECERLMLVGHNPGMEDLLFYLTDEVEIPDDGMIHEEQADSDDYTKEFLDGSEDKRRRKLRLWLFCV